MTSPVANSKTPSPPPAVTCDYPPENLQLEQRTTKVIRNLSGEFFPSGLFIQTNNSNPPKIIEVLAIDEPPDFFSVIQTPTYQKETKLPAESSDGPRKLAPPILSRGRSSSTELRAITPASPLIARARSSSTELRGTPSSPYMNESFQTNIIKTLKTEQNNLFSPDARNLVINTLDSLLMESTDEMVSQKAEELLTYLRVFRSQTSNCQEERARQLIDSLVQILQSKEELGYCLCRTSSRPNLESVEEHGGGSPETIDPYDPFREECMTPN